MGGLRARCPLPSNGKRWALITACSFKTQNGAVQEANTQVTRDTSQEANTQKLWHAQGTRSSPAAVRRSERLVAALAPPSVPARLYPLRRLLPAFGIEPGQPRDAHTSHANARARRSQVDAAARNSQHHVSVVLQRRVGRRTAVGRSG